MSFPSLFWYRLSRCFWFHFVIKIFSPGRSVTHVTGPLETEETEDTRYIYLWMQSFTIPLPQKKSKTEKLCPIIARNRKPQATNDTAKPHKKSAKTAKTQTTGETSCAII